LGPEFFVGAKTKWGFIGGLFNYLRDVHGTDEYKTSITGGQYF